MKLHKNKDSFFRIFIQDMVPEGFKIEIQN